MPKYAVKLGEIHLQSDKPITMELRREILRVLGTGELETDVGGAIVVLRLDKLPVDGH